VARSEHSELMQLVAGYQKVQALYAAVALRIPDLLGDEALTSDELARATDADPRALYRLLRALATIDVVEPRDGDRFALTGRGAELRAPAIRNRLLFVGLPHHWNTWSHLLHSVRTGENAFHAIHGETVWEYRAKHPEESAAFDAWQDAATRDINEAIVSGFDFGRFAHVVDVGGGRGALLAAILRANPATRATLFDQPHVVADAEPLERLQVVGGSFFESVPAGGDAYLLKTVIHDWRDPEAVAILRTIADALEGDARVLIIERDLADPATPWTDLQMLVMAGGEERSEEEYASLFNAANLEPVGMTRVAEEWAVFEGRKA
jgi:hypothetical protein